MNRLCLIVVSVTFFNLCNASELASEMESEAAKGRASDEHSELKSPKSPRGRGMARVVRRSQTVTKADAERISPRATSASEEENGANLRRIAPIATISKATAAVRSSQPQKSASLPTTPLSPRRKRDPVNSQTFKDPIPSPRTAKKLGGHRKQQELSVAELDEAETEVLVMDQDIEEFLVEDSQEIKLVLQEELGQYEALNTLFVSQVPLSSAAIESPSAQVYSLQSPSPELQAPAAQAPPPPVELLKMDRSAASLRGSAGRRQLTDSSKLRIVLRGRNSGAEVKATDDAKTISSPDRAQSEQKSGVEVLSVSASPITSPCCSPRTLRMGQAKAAKLLGVGEAELSSPRSPHEEIPETQEAQRSPRLKAKGSAAVGEGSLSTSGRSVFVSSPHMIEKNSSVSLSTAELPEYVIQRLKKYEASQELKSTYASWLIHKKREAGALDNWQGFFSRFSEYLLGKLKEGKLDYTILDLEPVINKMFKTWLETDSEWQ